MHLKQGAKHVIKGGGNVNFLGLDLSVANTGVVVIDQNNKILHKDVLRTKPKTSTESRIIIIWDGVLQVHNNFKPQFIYIEELAYGARGDAMLELAGVNYYVRTRFTALQIAFKMITPGTLKKFVTGKGTGKKELMLKEVYKKWGEDFDDNNECDAYCLARMAWTENQPKVNKIKQTKLKLR